MAKATAEIRSLARAHTKTAISALVGIMNQKKAPPAARVSAANALLDRGWGKPTQPHTDDEGGPVKLIIKHIDPTIRPEKRGPTEAT